MENKQQTDAGGDSDPPELDHTAMRHAPDNGADSGVSGGGEGQSSSQPEFRLKAQPQPQPLFMIPTAMIWLAGILVLVHVVRLNAPGDLYYRTVAQFAFLPARFVLPPSSDAFDLAVWITPVSHAFLHADWGHLAVNCFWMVAFATPVLRRLGTVRFLAMFAGASASGALFYFLLGNPYAALPMVGASGAVSGFMGAAARFALANIAPGQTDRVHLGRRMSLAETFTDRSTLTFIAGFAVVNAVAGAGLITPDGAGGIAWQAHVGGFAFGLIAFSAFDPMRRAVP
ncbi:MAG: rhomboid family intramembrane serine protease [Pseudomonadota bacterium]